MPTKSVKTTKKTPAPKKNSAVFVSTEKSSGVLKNPRITEKSGIASDKSVYTFDIFPDANKLTVARAFEAKYKIKPIKVRIGRTPHKAVFVRGRKGVKQGGKKAMIYLKKGDKIEFI